MEPDRGPSIAQQTSKCLKTLRELVQKYKERDWKFGEYSSEDIPDALARFRTWVDNIGALQTGGSSLDHRLRHADVRDEVLRLLSQLLQVLEDLLQIASGARVQMIWTAFDPLLDMNFGDDKASDDDSDDSDKDTDKGASAISADDHTELTTECQILYSLILESITSLLKLSMFIRKSTRGNKFGKSSRAQKYETQYDINHVRDRFPFASRWPHLVERLGKANAQRRQWLSYQRRHREKLAVPASTDEHGTSFGLDLALDSNGEGLQPYKLAGKKLTEPSVRTEEREDPYSTLSSTKASTFYQKNEEPGEITGTDLSETSGSETSFSDSGYETNLVPQPPPEAADQSPFECPYCFSIITIAGNSAWRKHVYSDLACYVCTQDHCSHPLFESRDQWFNHELEEHRKQWVCASCQSSSPSIDLFKNHMSTEHPGTFLDNQLASLASRSARPLPRISASACPLCDYEAVIKRKLHFSVDEGPITVPTRTFRNHLGHHLEQLALFVLPKQDLTEQEEDVGDTMVAIEGQITISGDTGESEDDQPSRSGTGSEQQNPESQVGKQRRRSLQTQSKFNEEIESRISDVAHSLDNVLEEHEGRLPFSDKVFDILESPPDLAFKWMPPMDFTPGAEDFEVDDEELMPRREEPMFGGDIFTPGWVRGYGPRKEGFCGRCSPGQWHNIEDSSYEKNLTYMHGIGSSGLSLSRPSKIRQLKGERGRWQVFCDKCCGWRQLRKTVRGWNWFRHCAREHGTPLLTPRLEDVPSSDSTQADERLVENLVNFIRRDTHVNFKSILGQNPRLGKFRDRIGRTLLHYAAEQGGIFFMFAITKALSRLETKASVINMKSNNGETSLMLAASQGHKDIVVWLIDNGADIYAMSADGMTALDEALEAGFTHIAGLFLSSMTEEDRREHHLRVVGRQLPQAAKVTSTGEKVLDLLYGPVRLGNANELSLFHNAVVQGNMGTIEILLRQGADIEDYSSTGEKALMLAASNSRYEVIELLLAHGADVNSTSTKGWTTLMHAVRKGDIVAVQQLIGHGADVNHLSPDRWTALAEATFRGHRNMTALLLEHGADTESRSSHDFTPLMHASYKGDERSVELLLEAGADVDVSSNHDETAILLAAAGGYTSIVAMLLEAGAMPEPAWAKGPNDNSEKGRQQAEEKAVGEPEDRAHARGWTPLMLASQGGHHEIARILLGKGVNSEVKSPHDKTALEIALENGWTEMEPILRGSV